MSHHAYFVAGESEAGITDALRFGHETLGLRPDGNPDVVVFRYDLFSVDDARRFSETAGRTAVGDAKLLVLSAKRFFHEAQNALLKAFEEPAPGTHIVLVVPSAGSIIQTLRSRLLPLPGDSSKDLDSLGEAFLSSPKEREDMVKKILARAKKDSPEEKQAARIEALSLAQSLMRAAYAKPKKDQALLTDLERFIPILHERSAPLKPILEHLLIALGK